MKLAAAAGLTGLSGCWFDESPMSTPSESREPTPTEVPISNTPGGTPSTPATSSPTPSFLQGPGVEAVGEELRAEWSDRFDSFVNVVAAGADASGGAPIDDVLDSAVADDTLLFFPDGTFQVGSIDLSNVENAGLVSPPTLDTTIAPAAPASEVGREFVSVRDAGDLLIDGFDFDFRADGHGGITQIYSRGDFTLRNVRVRGSMPGSVNAFRFDVADESGVGRVENVVATDGSASGGSVGIYVGEDHAGELTIRNCRVANFPNNGLYASTPGTDDGGNGEVHVEGGVYRNNNISNVRLGTTGSTARDVTVVMDRTPPRHPNGLNVRGIRLRRRNDLLVENCEIEIGEDAGEGFGGIIVHSDAHSSTVRDTRVTVDRDGTPGIHVFPSDEEATADPDRTAFEGVRIEGAASGGVAASVHGRDGVEFVDCSIRQSGEDRGGIAFRSSNDCLVRGSTIVVTGTPIERVNSSVEVRASTVRQEGVDGA